MKKIFSIIAPALGFLFLLVYIRTACVDVVYTDYIRIINTYLGNVFSIKPYLRADVLTRIPINYIERVINVMCFGYSTIFDIIMGIVGLALSACVLLLWSAKRNVNMLTCVVIFIVMFALDKWEMITNGTGWVHFWAFALFFYHYVVYDRVRSGRGKTGDETRLRVLPFVTILLFSGPYCAIYAGALTVVYFLDLVLEKKSGKEIKDWIIRLGALLIPFALFCISRHFSVEEIAGATERPLSEALASDPMYFVRFLVKSFASMVIGGETAVQYGISGTVLFIFGLIIMAAYVWAVILNFKKGLFKRTALPMLLLVSGLISHGIVLWSRWVFMDDMYAMSSRYALQFQTGIIGIILTLSMTYDRKKTVPLPTVIAAAFIFLIVAGRAVTTRREINTAPFRKAYLENVREIALHSEEYDDETIKAGLQYSKPEKTRQALKILKEKQYNIFQ